MRSRKRIVVGIDHTPNGMAALRWAARQAVLRGWDLVALRAFRLPGRPERVLEADLDGERRAAHDRAQTWVAGAVRGLDDDVLDRLRVRVRTVDGEIVPVLATASASAALLVVGTPCSEDRALVDELDERAACPVVHVEADGVVHDVCSLAKVGLG